MSQDLADYYYLVGRNRGAGLPEAAAFAQAEQEMEPLPEEEK